MSFFSWRSYVPVAARRRRAEREIANLKKKGRSTAPVTISGRNIATSFWGKAWCSNLERYSDYVNRLPRGRTYVRNGSVVDLQIAKGEVTALVAGSSLYRIKISVAPVKSAHWKAICRDCAGSVASLVELLQGRFEKGVMDRVCRAGDGLFPAPREITLSCSCPDWADMCKHVAAALYGVGARLDHKPQLLFVLRGVDENELIAGASGDLALPRAAPGRAKVLDENDVAVVFGLEMDNAVMTKTGKMDAAVAPARLAKLNSRTERRSVKMGKPSPCLGGPKSARSTVADFNCVAAAPGTPQMSSSPRSPTLEYFSIEAQGAKRKKVAKKARKAAKASRPRARRKIRARRAAPSPPPAAAST
jgi:uncharacterized Zn finger protein